MSFAAMLLVSLATCTPPSRAIVAEVYYDAPGDDTGHEFVELFNPTALDVALQGLRLEAGDGAGAARWTLRWTGGASDTLRALTRFVIGGALVQPAPDATVALDLQNGPDALRLVWPDGATEVVGWGALTLPEYYCGTPAEDVASGQSLARTPDDSDAGSNAADFRTASPSPGRANVLARDLALTHGGMALQPERPAAGAVSRIACTVRNLGSAPTLEGESRLTIESDLLDAPIEHALPALPARDSLRVMVELPPLASGRGVLRARVLFAGDQDAADDLDSLAVRAGESPLAIVEVQFHPASGEGEWVEVRNAGTVAWPLQGLVLGDRTGSRGRARAFALLAPESLAVLAQDRDALLARYPMLDTARVVALSPWASLNNLDDSLGIADQVVLAEADGVTLERIAYSAAGVAAGVTLERDGDDWYPGPEPGGTPLALPRAPAAIAGVFAIEPRRVRAGERDVRFAWQLPWPRARVALELYDLEGRRARRLDAFTSGSHGERHVALDALEPGLYLAVLRAQADQGSLTRVAPLRVDSARP